MVLLSLLFLNEAPGQARRVVKWGYIYHGDGVPAEVFSRKYPDYSFVAITGFTLNENGLSIHPGASIRYGYLKSRKISSVIFYPVITFSNAKTGHVVLNDSNIRKRCVRSIGRSATSEGWSGVHFDFEYLPASDCRLFALFLEEIRRDIPGIKISIAVFPRIDFPLERSGFHDLKVLAGKADEFVLMCYDFHGPGTAIGPVTDIDWTEKNIRAALAFIPAKNLWLGVPAYGYKWDISGKAGAVSSREASLLGARYGIRRDVSGTAVVSYLSGGRKHMLYFSDRITRGRMQSLALRYGLAGIALWRIGFEE